MTIVYIFTERDTDKAITNLPAHDSQLEAILYYLSTNCYGCDIKGYLYQIDTARPVENKCRMWTKCYYDLTETPSSKIYLDTVSHIKKLGYMMVDCPTMVSIFKQGSDYAYFSWSKQYLSINRFA